MIEGVTKGQRSPSGVDGTSFCGAYFPPVLLCLCNSILHSPVMLLPARERERERERER